MSASLVEGPAAAGTRGEAITLGALALAFITSGSAVALLSALLLVLATWRGLPRIVDPGGEATE